MNIFLEIKEHWPTWLYLGPPYPSSKFKMYLLQLIKHINNEKKLIQKTVNEKKAGIERNFCFFYIYIFLTLEKNWLQLDNPKLFLAYEKKKSSVLKYSELKKSVFLA